jgi:hypothetical protein
MQGREKRKEGEKGSGKRVRPEEKGSGLKDCKIARPVSQSKFSLFSDAKVPDFMPGGFFQLIANFQTLSCRFSAHPRPEKNQCLLQFWKEIRIL